MCESVAAAQKDDPCSQSDTIGGHGSAWSNVLKILSKSMNRKTALACKMSTLACYYEESFVLAIMRLAIYMYACNSGSRCTKDRRSQRRSRMCTLQQMQGKGPLQAFSG